MSFIDNIELLCQMEDEKITPAIIKLGISPGSLSRWRNGATINSDLLLKIAERFGVSTDFILTGKDSIAKRKIYPDQPMTIESSKGEMDAETKAMLQRYNALPEPLKAQCRTFVLATYSASNFVPQAKEPPKTTDDIVISASPKIKGEENKVG